MCVCVCACEWAGVWVHGRACVHACMRVYVCTCVGHGQVCVIFVYGQVCVRISLWKDECTHAFALCLRVCEHVCRNKQHSDDWEEEGKPYRRGGNGGIQRRVSTTYGVVVRAPVEALGP